jgi:hypothetical protein
VLLSSADPHRGHRTNRLPRPHARSLTMTSASVGLTLDGPPLTSGGEQPGGATVIPSWWPQALPEPPWLSVGARTNPARGGQRRASCSASPCSACLWQGRPPAVWGTNRRAALPSDRSGGPSVLHAGVGQPPRQVAHDPERPTAARLCAAAFVTAPCVSSVLGGPLLLEDLSDHFGGRAMIV